jgi:urease accessory protein
MNPAVFVHALQISDSFLPVGGFAYSDGLETAAAANLVRDPASLGAWMDHFLENVFVPCEVLSLVKCMKALRAEDRDVLRRIDEELTAIRPSSEVRASSIGVGKRLLSLYGSICGDKHLADYESLLPHGNAAAAYAVVFFHCGVEEREAILAYGYNRMAGIVSAGLRLISIGQQQGQELLSRATDRLPAAAERILQTADEPLRSFSPALDIQQMNHQYVYSRLFRS